jgi:hypothetical protein
MGMRPQIMTMIENMSKIDFLKEHEMTDLKPQFLNEPVIFMDVPSASTGPRSTCSGSAAPSPVVSSSSSCGVLRMLKSMFAWCCVTRQRQDVLLSNQRCKNEKMGIDEFGEFPLPVPPLADGPFATLSAADITAMEAAPNADEAFGSEFEDEEEGKDEYDDDDK